MERDPTVMRLIDRYATDPDPDYLEIIQHRLARRRPPAHVLANPLSNLKLTSDAFNLPGLHLGTAELPDVHASRVPVTLPNELLMKSSLFAGDVGSGKTNAVHVALLKLIERGWAAVVFDHRFDYVGLARHIPRTLLVTRHTLKDNVLGSVPGVSITTLYDKFSETFRDALGLFLASELFLRECLTKLEQRLERTGHYSHLGDLQREVTAIEVKPRSPREGYKERCWERVTGLIKAFGDHSLFVERGLPFVEMLDNSRLDLLLFHCIDYPTWASNFLAFWLLQRVHLHRVHMSEARYRPLAFVLDEAHTLVREGSVRGQQHK